MGENKLLPRVRMHTKGRVITLSVVITPCMCMPRKGQCDCFVSVMYESEIEK